MESIGKIDKGSYKKILPTYLLLVFFPILFALLLYLFILRIDKNHEIEIIKSELSDRAANLMSKATALDYFKPHLEKLASQLFPFVENRPLKNGHFLTSSEITKLIEDARKTVNENLRCALFDNDGNLICSEDLLNHEKRYFDFVWKNINNEGDFDYNGQKADRTRIVGRDFNLKILSGYSERCLPISSFGKLGVFYFKKTGIGNSGVIIFVEYNKTNLELIEAKIKDFASKEQPIILYDIAGKCIKTPTYGHKEIPYEQTESESFLTGFYAGDMVWRGVVSEEYKLLVGQKFPYIEYVFKLILAIILFILLLSAASYFFFKNIANTDGIYISIRYKLMFIFVLAIYMPILGLWALSYTRLKDHRTALENNIKKGMLDVLNKIDNGYRNRETAIKNSYLKLDKYLHDFKGKKPPTSKEIEDKLREIVGRDQEVKSIFTWVDIRSIDQQQIYTTSSKYSNERFKRMARAISLLCLEKFCPDRLSHAHVKANQSDMFVGNLLENPVLGFSAAFERPGEIFVLTFEGVNFYWWWNYFPDEDNEIAFYICNTGTNYLTNSYFESLKNVRYTFENTIIKVVNFNYGTQAFIPDSKSNKKELLDLINVSNLSKSVETANIYYENNYYLCLCSPGGNLRNCFSLCMYPLSQIDYQIDKVRSSIYALMVLLLIISALTGSLLAKTVIIPIKELSRGLEALRKRETETRIEIENQDELGKLGQTFNQMMVDIKDMLLAGAVQQCLIPTGRYEADGYDCIVYNQMATDVGGDYADIFELPEDRVLFVIGDVTGHGVASSLLTAMVKASVFGFASRNTTLDEMVTNTSNMICDLLNKKKLMTFCAIVLDKQSGELTICNAGHPYPIIKAKEPGSIRTIGKTTLPMGLNKKRCRYVSEKDVLNPEETLILYTDGFHEAENEKGEEYGFDNFKKLISDYSFNSSGDLKDHLISVFEQHHGKGKELADDITFVIVKREKVV